MYQQNYTNFYFNKRGSGNGTGYSPQSAGKFGSGTKKAVKHFTDLEVYQKALESSVFISKNICRSISPCHSLEKGNPDPIIKDTIGDGTKEFIIKNMTALALSIPHQIAEAHSSRFGSSEQCLLILDKVMLNCNKMVVYLDQTRDICETGVELEQFEEQIKKYFFIRQKVLNLQRVWKKYIEINKQEQKP